MSSMLHQAFCKFTWLLVHFDQAKTTILNPTGMTSFISELFSFHTAVASIVLFFHCYTTYKQKHNVKATFNINNAVLWGLCIFSVAYYLCTEFNALKLEQKQSVDNDE